MFIWISFKATISLKIINKGIPTKLKFGKNGNLDFIIISSTNLTCDENFEIAQTVLIRNGEIIESECEKRERFLVLSTYRSANNQTMISFPGEYFIWYILFKIKENTCLLEGTTFLYQICSHCSQKIYSERVENIFVGPERVTFYHKYTRMIETSRFWCKFMTITLIFFS